MQKLWTWTPVRFKDATYQLGGSDTYLPRSNGWLKSESWTNGQVQIIKKVNNGTTVKRGEKIPVSRAGYYDWKQATKNVLRKFEAAQNQPNDRRNVDLRVKAAPNPPNGRPINAALNVGSKSIKNRQNEMNAALNLTLSKLKANKSTLIAARRVIGDEIYRKRLQNGLEKDLAKRQTLNELQNALANRQTQSTATRGH